MYFKIISILISLIAGFAILRYIQKSDKYEPEPLPLLISVMVFGGIFSVITSLFLYWISDSLLPVKNFFYNLSPPFQPLYMIIIVGPFEEFSKLFALFLLHPFIKKNMNEPVDGVIYITCIALGFSLIENYFYANSATGNETLIIIRLSISTPAHISFSAIMGYRFYQYYYENYRFNKLFSSLIIAALLHGLFNFILSIAWLYFLFVPYFRFIQMRYKKIFDHTLINSPFRLSLTDFIRTYSSPEMKNIFPCPLCGIKNPKKTYNFQNIIIQKCDKCKHFVTNEQSLIRIFNHFAYHQIVESEIKTTYKNNSRRKRIKYKTIVDNNYICTSNGVAFFDLEKLNKTLEKWVKIESYCSK